ncbi:MAG: Slp family lipoprotein [Nitrospirae bacterium]|nr:Slp family lipoprotein [Nitrospirota bacterium]
MKRIGVIALVLSASFLFSCAPVIKKEYMDVGIRNLPLSELRQNPDQYRGKLFILGGIIANAHVTPAGSLIEAIYVPVDSRGYLEGSTDGRYLALFPKEGGMLDPAIYHKGRRITVAAAFVELREGKIDETKYLYPFFEIREIHLWQQRVYVYPPPYYYYPYYPYSWWDYPYGMYRPFW